MGRIRLDYEDGSSDDYLLNGKNDFDRIGTVDSTEDGDDGEPKHDTVVDVSVNNTKNSLVVYLNCVKVDGGVGKFSNRTYLLSAKSGTLGMFDLLDDFFMGRFRFFYSSKTVQAFMMAIVEAERKFKKQSGFALHEYCAKITGLSLKDMADDESLEKSLSCRLHGGYGIRNEAMSFNERKRRHINMKYMEQLGIDVVKGFLKNMKYIDTKHFVSIAVNTIDDLEPSLLIDPFVGLPMVMYMPEFVEILIAKVAHSFMGTPTFRKAEIDHIYFEIFLLMPETTVADMKEFARADGEIRDYGSIEEEDFIVGRYKTYDICESDVSEDDFDSIICYGN